MDIDDGVSVTKSITYTPSGRYFTTELEVDGHTFKKDTRTLWGARRFLRKTMKLIRGMVEATADG